MTEISLCQTEKCNELGIHLKCFALFVSFRTQQVTSIARYPSLRSAELTAESG
jgi:hypothetical protein